MAIVIGRINKSNATRLMLLEIPRTANYSSNSFRTTWAQPKREPAQVRRCVSPTWLGNAEEAFVNLKSGDTVFVQGAAGTPLLLLEGMTAVGKARKLKDITVCHIHTEGNAGYHTEKDTFRSCSFFMGGNVRKPVAEGRADVVPIFLSDIPQLFSRKIIEPNFALIHVSPPDKHGYCSTGTSVDCVRAAMVYTKNIIAQINPKMPRTFGDGIIHISQIDYALCADVDLPVHGGAPPNPIEKKIGKLIAESLIDDGATLQLGIGNIPDAVLQELQSHKDLGIHSEMFADGVVDLVEKGVITNSKKTMHQGHVVGSFLLGTKRLYDFVHDNLAVQMLKVEYVNNTKIIAKQPKMTAINSCIEIDLTGQINSDSIGTKMYSGFGGQVDFIRGAAEALDGLGRPIITMSSTTKNNESKICSLLKPGAGVVTTRGHAHFVVTEYGIASLFGKTLRQRAYALINIAHPDHREVLQKAAYERLRCMPVP